MSASLFVDTSGWAAPLLTNTDHYNEMMAFSQQIVAHSRTLVTTNYVIAELVALLGARSHLARQQLLDFVEGIRTSAQLVFIDAALDVAAWRMLRQHADKEWSLADAASFVVMRDMGITEAFSSDQHFSQAGFVRLPHF
jgi:uncharacterized protein